MDISNVFIELFAIPQWGALHVFGLDLALGLGEVALDTIRLSKVVAFFLITTPCKIAFEIIRKLIQLYTKPHVRSVGVVENMKIRDTSFIEKLSERA
ncbi:P-loop NTPase [Candidatus Bathyarchaeota archaeon]|nr:P-loop NTPase [Candidatus Bathyarchaeota archaeon]